MFRYFARRRRRRSKKEHEDEHNDEEAVQLLLPIAADEPPAKQAPAPPPSQQEHYHHHRQQQQQQYDAPASQQPHTVTWGNEEIHFVQRLVEKPQQQQQHHASHDGELCGLVQKLATKLQQSEARNKKLANNLSVVKVLQLQLDDARRLLRAVLWPYHGDYNSKDYIKAVEHVSALRVELRQQRETHETWMAKLEALNKTRKEASPEEMMALLDEQERARNEVKIDETQTHATLSVLQEQNTSLQEQVTTLQQRINRLEDERDRHVKEIGALLERSMQLQEELETTKSANADREDTIDVAEQRSDLNEGDLDELMKQFKHESEHLFE